MTTNFEVIDQFFAAQVACNESEATLKALRPQMEAQLKDLRADIKRTAEKLEKAHPESESIKHAFRLTIMG